MLATCALLATAAARADISYTILAKTGQPAPDAPFNYNTLRTAQFHEDGRISFINRQDDPEHFDPLGVFVGSPGGFSPLVYEGQPLANSSGGEKIIQFGNFDVSAGGLAVWAGYGNTDTSSGFGSALFFGPQPQSLSPIIHGGDPAPGIDGMEISEVLRIRVGNSGDVAFSADTRMSGPRALFIEHGGNVHLITKVGDAAPGVSGGHINADPGPLTVRANGEVIYDASVLDGSGARSAAIYAANADSSRLITRSGVAVAGTEEKFDEMNVILASANGAIAFDAALNHAGQALQESGVYAGHEGNIRLVARSGWAAPGTGGVWRGDPAEPGFPEAAFELQDANSSEQVIFTGRVAGADPDDWGIWAGRRDEVRLIARSGAQAPGTGMNFARTGPAGSGNAPFFRGSINEAGEVGFMASLEDGFGIFATDALGDLHLLARTGGQIRLDDGTLLPVDGLDHWLNNEGFSGQNVFTVRSGDQYMVVLASVPEPSALAYLALVGLAMIRRRSTSSGWRRG